MLQNYARLCLLLLAQLQLQPFVPEVKKLNDKAEREERKQARNESRTCIKVLLSIAFSLRADSVREPTQANELPEDPVEDVFE